MDLCRFGRCRGDFVTTTLVARMEILSIFIFIIVIYVEVETLVLCKDLIQRFNVASSTMMIRAVYATKIFYYMFYSQDLYIEVGALQYMDLDSKDSTHLTFLSGVCYFTRV